jgi:filamentous hemagglutinin family protein
MRLLSFSLLCTTASLFAIPSEFFIKEGSAKVEHVESHSIKIHTSNKTILQHKKFDIASYEKVEFVQPNASSAVLNRVEGNNPSHIFGSLESNGKIFLVNPNGIYFGKNAKVSASSFLASTLDISNEDFLKDRFSFVIDQDKKKGYIRNEGIIRSTEGSIVLLAPFIQNSGSLEAVASQILLASAEHVTLDFQGSHLLSFSVEGEIKDALIENLGRVEAKQGSVFIKLATAREAIKATLNREGIEVGAVFTEQNGKIILAPLSSLQADSISLEGSNIQIEGSIDLSNSLKEAGSLNVVGKDISLDNLSINASGKTVGGNITLRMNPYCDHVFASDSVLINANGDCIGGTILIHSLKSTSFHGTIYAEGGDRGGFIETSSLGHLCVKEAYVHTLSPNGLAGMWLIDPSEIRIAAIGSGVPTDCTSGGIIDVSTLEAQSSNVSLCADVIIQEVPISMNIPEVGLIFSSPAGSRGSLTLQEDITTKGGKIVATGLDVVIENSLTLTTTGSGSFGANISLGSLETNGSPHSITLLAGMGEISVDTIGAISPLGSTTLSGSLVTLQSIFTDNSAITITSPISIKENAVFSTQGGNITLSTVDSIGSPYSLALDAGVSGNISVEAIGSTHPLKNITIVRANLISVENISSYDGSILLEAPATLLSPSTTFEIINGGFDAQIRIRSIEGTTPYEQSLYLSTNLKNRTVLLSGGETIPLDTIIIGPSREVTLGPLKCSSFTLTESLGKTDLRADIKATERIDIRGGILALNGTLEAATISLFGHGPILSASSHEKILFHDFLSLNAQGAAIGSLKKPIFVSTENHNGSILLGAKDLASLSGPSYQKSLIQLNPVNYPCVVLFNKRAIQDCNKNQRNIFNLINRSFFINAYQNGIHLGIGKNPLLQLGPYFLSSYYTYDFPERIVNESVCEKEGCEGQLRAF